MMYEIGQTVKVAGFDELGIIEGTPDERQRYPVALQNGGCPLIFQWDLKLLGNVPCFLVNCEQDGEQRDLCPICNQGTVWRGSQPNIGHSTSIWCCDHCKAKWNQYPFKA